MPFTTLDADSSLSPSDRDDLVRTACWAHTASLAGAAMLVVTVAGGVLFGLFLHRVITQLQPLLGPGAASFDPTAFAVGIIAIYVIGGGLFVMPVVFLFQYAQRMRAAVRA